MSTTPMTPPTMFDAPEPTGPSVLCLTQLRIGLYETVRTWLVINRATPGTAQWPDWSAAFEGTCPNAARHYHVHAPLERGAQGWAICRTCDAGWQAVSLPLEPAVAGMRLLVLQQQMLLSSAWSFDWRIAPEEPPPTPFLLEWVAQCLVGEVTEPYTPGRVQQLLLDPGALDLDSGEDRLAEGLHRLRIRESE